MKRTRLIDRFSEKKSHFGKWAILDLKMAHPHDPGSTVRIFKILLRMKGPDRCINFF